MVNVAILGFGVVGSGAAEVLTANSAIIEKKVGTPIAVKRILDLREWLIQCHSSQHLPYKHYERITALQYVFGRHKQGYNKSFRVHLQSADLHRSE